MTGAIRHSKINALRFFGVLLMALSLPANRVFAQAMSVDITSTPNPVGSGARALGMGGAFIAVADDATAASWNPAGLVQLERPELSVVGAGFYRSENNQFADHPESSGGQHVSNAGLNYLSAAYPFTLLNRNMIVSINYQHLYDFSRQWDFMFASGRDVQNLDFSASGGLYAWGLAYALQIVPQLSFGFTLNFWQDGIYRNGWDTEQTGTLVHKLPYGDQAWTYRFTTKHRYAFSGFNANVGLLWNVTEQLALGAVIRTPFTADLKHEYSSEYKQVLPSGEIPVGYDSKATDEELDMPMSFGFGVAFRFSDRMTLSADAYHTAWQDFILTDAKGRKISPITKGLARKADVDSTTQVRVGAEYLFIKPEYTVPVRVGFFYDPAPAQGTTDEYFGLSLGSGIGLGRFIFDAAYVYRFGRNVGESTVPGLGLAQDINEHGFFTSLIVHF